MDNERIISDFLVSKTDTNGKIIYCNEEFIKISGYTEKEFLNIYGREYQKAMKSMHM